MNYIIHIFLFIIIFLFYIHFYNQNTYSNSLQIYELDYNNNYDLQKICDLKQPTIFKYNLNSITNFDINILFDNSNSIVPIKQISEFLIENNTISTQNFVNIEDDSYIDIEPPSSFFVGHNILCGSKNTHTKSLIHNYHRKFIYVDSGKIEINIIPFNSSPNNKIINNYEHYEFFVKQDLSDIGEKCVINKNHIINIPPNCLYSIKFIEDYNICVDYSFHSIVSYISNIHKQLLYLIQQNNIQNTPNNIKLYEKNVILSNDDDDKNNNNNNDNDNKI